MNSIGEYYIEQSVSVNKLLGRRGESNISGKLRPSFAQQLPDNVNM